MKLFLNQASPYARIIRVLLAETGLDVETELVFVDPWASPENLLATNPASKVPALTLDDGTRLIESSCIADHLIHHSGKAALSPLSHADAAERLQILGLGRAALDCAFASVIQQRFVPDSSLTERWLGALPRIAESLEAAYFTRKPTDDFDQADLTVAVAFEYIDYRLPEIQWKDIAPHLAEWVRQLGQRPSLAAIRPT